MEAPVKRKENVAHNSNRCMAYIRSTRAVIVERQATGTRAAFTCSASGTTRPGRTPLYSLFYYPEPQSRRIDSFRGELS